MSPSLPHNGRSRTSALALLAILQVCLLMFSLNLPTARAQTTEPCQCIPDFITASDVNCDGLVLSVADYVLLLRAVSGDTTLEYQLDSGCSTELDGYRNSFFPCKPTIGDIVALARYFELGLGSIPTIDCANLKEPLPSELELVATGPLAISGSANKQYSVSLRNAGVDSAFVWGLTIPLELKMFGSDFAAFSFSIDSGGAAPNWNIATREIDSANTLLTVFPDQLGHTEPVALGPGDETPLFEFSLDWLTAGGVYLFPRLLPTAPNSAPYIVSSQTSTGPPATEVLTLTLENCCGTLGDANYDGRFSIGDIVYLIDLIFGDLQSPECPVGADINRDNSINIGDVTTGVGYIFVESPDLTCGTCAVAALVSNELREFGGDINLNGISHEIADWVVLTNYLLRGDDAFNGDPLTQLSEADVDLNCTPATVGDFVALWRVIQGETAPPLSNSVAHYQSVATITVADGAIATDSNIRAALLIFAGQAELELLDPSAVLGFEYTDGYTRALVYFATTGIHTVLGDMINADRAPIYVEAADSLGALYEIEIIQGAPGAVEPALEEELKK